LYYIKILWSFVFVQLIMKNYVAHILFGRKIEFLSLVLQSLFTYGNSVHMNAKIWVVMNFDSPVLSVIQCIIFYWIEEDGPLSANMALYPRKKNTSLSHYTSPKILTVSLRMFRLYSHPDLRYKQAVIYKYYE
jgi:hypothetical protein